jgi:hypothetical protein
MLINDGHADWNEVHNDTRPGIATLHTDGTGWWSQKVKTVRVTQLELGWINSEKEYGELLVHFNTDDWRPDKDGLIYTDPLFHTELLAYLSAEGFDASDVEYSEQGMQLDNAVSLDVGERFLATWFAKFKRIPCGKCGSCSC